MVLCSLEIWFLFQMLCAIIQIVWNWTRGFKKVIRIFHCFETVALWNKWRGSFLKKNGSLHPMMLGAKFGWISLIVLENMMFSKKVSVFLLFCYYLPLRMFVQTWIFLSMYTSWHLRWNCLCLVIATIFICKMVWSLVTKDFLSSMQSFSASFVSVQFETYFQLG